MRTISSTEQKLRRLDNLEFAKELESIVNDQPDDVGKAVIREAARRIGKAA